MMMVLGGKSYLVTHADVAPYAHSIYDPEAIIMCDKRIIQQYVYIHIV